MNTGNGGNRENTIRDFAIYGTYAADIRFRQERIHADIMRSHRRSRYPGKMREWLGTALVRIGTRLETGSGDAGRASNPEMTAIPASSR